MDQNISSIELMNRMEMPEFEEFESPN